MSERETWTGRIGFIIAAVGSAVGLGNIWSFPFQVASNGGAAFLVVYLIAVFLIGFPALLVEFVIGRRSKLDAILAFDEIGHGNWTFVGILGVAAATFTLAFYSVVGGWVIRYMVGSLSGAYFAAPGEYFGAVSAGAGAIGLHAVFMGITIAIVAFGVAGGIERATKVMIPAIIVLLIGLGVWASTLEGVGAGYAYYLSPDIDVMMSNLGTIIPWAVGQAFFTLSVGFGVLIAYASYLGRDHSLPADGAAIVVINTLVALLAGFVVFPILSSIGQLGELGAGGLGAAFTSLAGAFGQIPGGEFIGFGFFAVLLLAALSSSISLLEAPVAFATERYGFDRRPAAIGIGAFIFLLGVPTAMSMDNLVWYNAIIFNLALPLAVLLLVLFVGWISADQMYDEVGLGSSAGDTFRTAWLWWVRTVVPVGVLLTLVLGIQSLLVRAGVLESAIFLA